MPGCHTHFSFFIQQNTLHTIEEDNCLFTPTFVGEQLIIRIRSTLYKKYYMVGNKRAFDDAFSVWMSSMLIFVADCIRLYSTVCSKQYVVRLVHRMQFKQQASKISTQPMTPILFSPGSLKSQCVSVAVLPLLQHRTRDGEVALWVRQEMEEKG